MPGDATNAAQDSLPKHQTTHIKRTRDITPEKERERERHTHTHTHREKQTRHAKNIGNTKVGSHVGEK